MFQLSKTEGLEGRRFYFLDEKTGKYPMCRPAVESVVIPPVDFPEFTAEYVKELQGKLKEANDRIKAWRPAR